MKLRSDLKNTMSVCARAEGREDETRSSLRATKVELGKAQDELRV